MVKSGDRKIFGLVLAAFALIELAVVYAAWNLPLVWDSSVYLAMGKNMFSLGRFGFWEVYRPPVMPIILGTGWFFGLEARAMRLVSLLISCLAVSALYLVVERLEGSRAALYSSLSLAGSFIFLRFTVDPLTGIAASGLILLSLYFLETDRMLVSGSLAGLAFLTRFPAALVCLASALYILQSEGYDLRSASRKILAYGGGFSVFLVMYLAASQVFFGSFFEPFATSLRVTSAATERYLFGLYFLWSAIESSPMYLLALPGLYVFSKVRSSTQKLFFIPLVIFYVFFTAFPHKVGRYVLLFLPLMAYFAGIGMKALENRAPIDPGKVRAALVGVGLIVMMANGVGVFGLNDYRSQERAEFYSYVSELNGTVASNDPRVNAYGDFIYEPVPPAKLDSVWEKRSEYDYVVINSCQWYCSNVGPGCRSDIREFESRLSNLTRGFESNADQCSYRVYSQR
ncbi:MAG: ArnT family glycosyltransferase [Candidatus Nanohaloarchaea archaeon]